MSQTQHGEYESEGTYQQYTEDDQFEIGFDLSWRDFDFTPELAGVGKAAREAAEKAEIFMNKVIEIIKVVAVTVVTLAAIMTVKILGEAYLNKS